LSCGRFRSQSSTYSK